jgi:hypothetical protein
VRNAAQRLHGLLLARARQGGLICVALHDRQQEAPGSSCCERQHSGGRGTGALCARSMCRRWLSCCCAIGLLGQSCCQAHAVEFAACWCCVNNLL